MSDRYPGNNFVILSLPRSGSTTLANLLNGHDDISCLVEPFNPGYHRGVFHKAAVNQSPDVALELVRKRFNGFKHVWDRDGWPFKGRPDVTEGIILNPCHRVIFLVRQNLLKRAVSHLICGQVRLWMGTREQFLWQAERTRFQPLDIEMIRSQIKGDRESAGQWLTAFEQRDMEVLRLDFEDLYDPAATDEARHARLNALLAFLNFKPMVFDKFQGTCAGHFDPQLSRWATPDIYDRVPGIHALERELGSDATGWLFRSGDVQ